MRRRVAIIDQTGTAEVIRLVGEHDLATVDVVRELVAPSIERGQPVVLDLSEVLFMDSTVIRLLREVQHAANDRGANIQFVLPTARNQAILSLLADEIAHLDLAFTMEEAFERIDRRASRRYHVG